MYPLTTTIQYIRRKIRREDLEEWESVISIGGRIVTNLRYADDTTQPAGTNEDLIETCGKSWASQ